jgi:nucleoside-diphosphate-sugar epimerase
MLLSAGHVVIGTTRSITKAEGLRAAGVEPVVVDVFEAAALSTAVLHVQPDIVVHQLTDLPSGLNPGQMTEGTQRNARMRSQGTQNLIAATLGAGVHRVIAQSIAWMYAPGKEPHCEDDPLDIDSRGTRAITVAGVATLERLTTSSPPIDGVVLRYGHLYGPGTGASTAEAPALHVDAAAAAAVLALEKAQRGIYNIAEPSGYPSTEKAQREFGFDAGARLKAIP